MRGIRGRLGRRAPRLVLTLVVLTAGAGLAQTVAHVTESGAAPAVSASYGGGHLMAADPSGGYWTAAGSGTVVPHGGAPQRGSPAAGGVRLNQPIVAMASTPGGGGYWLVASDGGIFSYGDAGFHGSAGDLVLNQPIVGMSVDQTGDGYWLVASDGGIFAYGTAPFYGSTGNLVLNRPIVTMGAT